MDTRCSARARETQTIGQLSAIRCVRTVGVAWLAHSASSAANSHEVARLFTGFSIKRLHAGNDPDLSQKSIRQRPARRRKVAGCGAQVGTKRLCPIDRVTSLADVA